MEKAIFTKFKLQMVKETSNKYEVERKISSPRDLNNVLTEVVQLNKECEEVFILITLNTKNYVTGIFEVHRGNINSCLIHPREVFKRALLNNASNIVIAHNHPSGDSTPSKEDINITLRLQEVGKIMDITLLDHIIIGDGNYTSLKEKGLL